MRKSLFSTSQTVAILKLHKAGILLAELPRENNLSTALICQLRSEFGDMDASRMKHLKE